MKNPKHDRQGVRTPVDIERKYNLGDKAEIMEIAANAQRAASNAEAVAREASETAAQATKTAEQATATAGQANSTASAANTKAAAAQSAVSTLGGNVYTKAQTLSSEVKEQLGLPDTATPSDAFAALGLSSGGESAQYAAGENISIVGNVISVITTDEAEIDNTRPITSAGVYTQIGNINVLLSTI